jgi:hypothetical protein
MKEVKSSLEDQMTDLQKQTQCPYADSKIFIFARAMDPYNRRFIVLECPAKRHVISGNADEWKVYEEDIRNICCNPDYANVCEWYKKVKK